MKRPPTITERVLTPEAEDERTEFIRLYESPENCSCFISPPCSVCTHPGNPRNQEEDESCWTTITREQTEEEQIWKSW